MGWVVSLELGISLTSRLAALGVCVAKSHANGPDPWHLDQVGPLFLLLFVFFFALAWSLSVWRLRETGGERPAANRRPKMLQLSARFDSRSSFGHQYSSAAHRLGDNICEALGA
jgi:hypothetical protein